MIALVAMMGCASRAPNQTLKQENRRLHDELAEARRRQAESDEQIKGLKAQLAQLEQREKTRETELGRLRTETSATSRELADARVRADAAAKQPPPVQCPAGSLFDPAAKQCVAIAVATPPPPVPAPPPPPAPVTARIVKVAIEDNAVVATVGAGSEVGVTKAWRAQLLRGDSAKPLVGGKADVIRVDKRTTQIRIRLTSDEVSSNPQVLLSPP